MDLSDLDASDLEELKKQMGALVPGGGAGMEGMSAADQAQFTEQLLGSMGTALEGMFSGKSL